MVAAGKLIIAVALSCVAVTAAFAQAPPAWPDAFVGRLEALALIQTLNAELLGSRSATQTLEKWCGDHRLADESTVVAKLLRGVEKLATAEQRERLRVAPADTVKYRRVQLQCGSHGLSEADNWYVPGRLTAEMNRLLETTDTSFGTVVRPLEPSRQTLAVTLLWSPLPPLWERGPAVRLPATTTGVLAIPAALFAHRAVLYTRDRVPFSEVYEVYQREILAFLPPR